MTTLRPTPWRRRLMPCAALLLVLPMLAACEGRATLTGPGYGYSGNPPADRPRDAALIGTWRRSLYFTDDAGNAYLSETTWTFRSSGDATRTVVAVSFDRGFADRIVSHARWTASGGELVVTWLPPRTGTTRLEYRAEAFRLMLGGDVFLRVD